MKNFSLFIFLSFLSATPILANDEYLAVALVCESADKDYQYFIINKTEEDYSSMCIDLLGNPRMHSKPFECTERGKDNYKNFFMTPDSFVSRFYTVDRKTLKAIVGNIFYDREDGKISRWPTKYDYNTIYQCKIAQDPTNIFNYVVNAKKLELDALFSTNKL
jgi:hypothetical protein